MSKIICPHCHTDIPLDTPEQRFWNYVDKGKTEDSCWTWIGSCTPNGYGNLTSNRKTCRAHRYSYEITYGKIPKGMCVCHKCDNRKCVRPDHLWLGTTFDNMRDMVSKGRAVGYKATRLTEDQVKDILHQHLTCKTSIGRLARQYSVQPSMISRIVNGRRWKSVYQTFVSNLQLPK